MTPLTCICVICSATFEARTSYGLCKLCYSKDRIREYDRLHSAIRHAERCRVPATLSLVQWLGTISDFNGLCAFCREMTFSYIDIVNPSNGLVWGNIVPICRACAVHKRAGSFEIAQARVNGYLAGVQEDDLLFHGEDEGIDRSCVPDASLYGDVELADFVGCVI